MSVQEDASVDPAIWEARPMYADQFYISTTELVRFTFGELISDNAARYHTAVVMTRANAAELRDLLSKVLSEP